MITISTVLRYLSFVATAVLVVVSATIPAAAAFVIKKIVDTNTPMPGGKPLVIGNTSLPAVSGNWVVFNAGDGEDLIIWRSTLAGQQLKKLITSDMFIPGWKDTGGNRRKFNQLYGQFHQIVGETLVVIGLPFAGATSGAGIFTRSVISGPIKNLVDTQNMHPDIAQAHEDKHFRAFPGDFALAPNFIVFQNNQKIFAIPIGGGAITAVAGQSTGTGNFQPPCPWCPLFDTPSIRGQKVLVRAGNVNGHASIQSVNRNGAKASWDIVAQHEMHAPNTPSDHGFNRFEFWGPVIDQTLVFGGGSSVDANYIGPYITGIYSSGATLRRLADTRMNVPGGTGKFVFTFSGVPTPILAKNGIVIFGAQDASNNPGLYAVRQTGGPVRKIIAVGDSIGGSTVSALNVGKGGFDGTTLVFTVGFTNFDAGFYATKVDLP